MTPFTKALPLLLVLAACGDGQPFFDDDAGGDGTVQDGVVPGDNTDNAGDGVNFDSSGGLPPGTEDPTPQGGIIRFEARDGDGGGLVTDVQYDRASDSFTVDNLGFDGQNVYQRGSSPSSIGGYAVYAANVSTPDSLTGEGIEQIRPYRMIYGTSDTVIDGVPRTSFALVRTGGYVNNGFGGYIYQRQGGVTLPQSGQAGFSGNYAGLRTFEGQTGLQYTRAEINIAVDFEDFNNNAAVVGTVFDRELFDDEGNAIAINGIGQDQLPNVFFVVQEGGVSITQNGEITGELGNTIVIGGEVQEFETGTYNGVIAGDLTGGDGGEIAGVIVLDSEDPLRDGINVRETGGFIVTR